MNKTFLRVLWRLKHRRRQLPIPDRGLESSGNNRLPRGQLGVHYWNLQVKWPVRVRLTHRLSGTEKRSSLTWVIFVE
jgi:hypothetical protein